MEIILGFDMYMDLNILVHISYCFNYYAFFWYYVLPFGRTSFLSLLFIFKLFLLGNNLQKIKFTNLKYTDDEF